MRTPLAWLLAGLLLGSLTTRAANPGWSAPSSPAPMPESRAAVVSGYPASPVSAASPVSPVSPVVPGAVPVGADAGTELAQTLSQITGVAISPLLGTGAVGAWRYLSTPEARRAELPWFAQPWFWIPALLLVGLVCAKDSLGPVTPTALKKPLDVMEVMENKISGLIAVGAFVPLVVNLVHAVGGEAPGTIGAGAGVALDPAAAGLAAATASPVVNALLTPFAMIAFVVVWLLGHVFNVLILISPFTTVDTALKLLRTALLGTVVGTAFVNPWIGGVWALAIIVVGAVLAGWSFRLTCLGSVFLFDILSRRRRWFRPDPASNWMFLSRELGDAPLRSYGRLSRGTGDGDRTAGLLFRYRPFLVGRERTVALPEGEYCVGRGLVYPDLLRLEGDDVRRYGILPPRYKRHEDEITRIHRLAPPRDVGVRAVWGALRELFGFGGAEPQPASAAEGASP